MEDEGISVLSFFDGMSCGQIAINRIGKRIKKYYACEIEQNSIMVTQKNYPNTIQLGNVENVHYADCEHIDLFIGGSPCQDISNLNKFKMGLDGDKSSLFFQYWRMWQEIKSKNPKAYFLLENVAGNKSAIKAITKLMGVRPIKISSNWVSAQNRMRYYWTNIPVNTLPKKKYLRLNSILEDNVDDKYYQHEGWLKWWAENQDFQLSKGYSTLNADKAACLTKRMYASWNGNFIQDKKGIRRLTPIECERLQTVPDNYTDCVDDKYRYEMLGNGWTVDIIAYILKHIPKT